MPTIAVEDTDEDTEKLRAFEKRMQLEGAAAFAAGPAPWEHWDDIGTLGTCQAWSDSVRHSAAEQPPGIPLSSRLLTGLAQFAVLALFIGTAGVFFSTITPEQLASTGIQPAPIVVAGRPALRPLTEALPVIRTQTDNLALKLPAVTTPGAAATQSLALLAAAVEPLVPEPAPATPAAVTADGSAGATDETIAMTLDTLPDTAAGSVIYTETPHTAVTVPLPEPADAGTAQTNPELETLPLQITLRTNVFDTLPDNPARKPSPAQDVRAMANTWVVNLASYTFESMAKRKLAAFSNKGVNAELVHVTVKGKPMVRIRTTGYKSAREARDWVALLEERLSLEGAWVAKYQPSEE